MHINSDLLGICRKTETSKASGESRWVAAALIKVDSEEEEEGWRRRTLQEVVSETEKIGKPAHLNTFL